MGVPRAIVFPKLLGFLRLELPLRISDTVPGLQDGKYLDKRTSNRAATVPGRGL